MRAGFDTDPGARRNRAEGGLWVINALVSVIVLLLSLYEFEAQRSRAAAREAFATVGALPDQLGASAAMAADRE